MSSITANSSTPDWENAPHFGRRDTILYTLRRSHQLCQSPPCIVETGCSRDERPEACNGDGWSTRAWGWYAEQTGGRAYTVDILPEAIEACKRITYEYATSIRYTASDSLPFLNNWPVKDWGEIDLLYLDSLDYSDPERSEKHHLAEAMAALPHLAPVCLVLFDDTVIHAEGSRGQRADGSNRAEQAADWAIMMSAVAGCDQVPFAKCVSRLGADMR